MIRIVELPPRPVVNLCGETSPSAVLAAVVNVLLDEEWTPRQVEMLIDELLQIETYGRLMSACRRHCDVRD